MPVTRLSAVIHHWEVFTLKLFVLECNLNLVLDKEILKALPILSLWLIQFISEFSEAKLGVLFEE